MVKKRQRKCWRWRWIKEGYFATTTFKIVFVIAFEKVNERCYIGNRWVLKIRIFYGDTDSVILHNKNYEMLKTKGLIWTNLYQSKTDYGKIGFSYGFFLAGKINYCIVFDKNGILSPKNFQRTWPKYSGIEFYRLFWPRERWNELGLNKIKFEKIYTRG